MNNGNVLIGVHVGSNTEFDSVIIEAIALKLQRTADELREMRVPVNRSTVARALGIPRNRVMRMTQKLGITGLFD